MTLEDGRTFIPGQGNNAYVFPGVALGVIAGGIRHIPDEIFLLTAEVSLPCILPVGPMIYSRSWPGPPKIPPLVSSHLLSTLAMDTKGPGPQASLKTTGRFERLSKHTQSF